MPENPHDKTDLEKETDKTDEKSSWSADQKKKSYYYDDAHGYEVYEVEDEDEEEPIGEDEQKR